MADEEDLYCNPQSNVFLQTRFQKKPPPTKKSSDKKGLFGRKPAQAKPELKPRVPVLSRGASDELGSLFKSGLTKPSELRKTAVPEQNAPPVEAAEDNHVVDFRAHLRHVPSPIKTEAENRRLSVTSDSDLPTLPIEEENDVDCDAHPVKELEFKSPPIPKRTSQLSISRRVPPPRGSHNDDRPLPTTKPDPLETVIKTDDECLPSVLPDLDKATEEAILPPPTPKRRPLKEPSKAPDIPVHTFPGPIILPDQLDYIPDPLQEDIYTDELDDYPVEDCDEMYTDNDVLTEPYNIPTLPQHDVPTLPTQDPPLYDSPKTNTIPREVAPSYDTVTTHSVLPPDEDEELYTDEVSDYPSFKQVVETRSDQPPQPPMPDYNVNEEGEEDIYDDAEFPMITQTCVDDYRADLEECDDIYDDIGSYNAPVRTASPITIQPSPLLSRHNNTPPPTLSAPPTATLPPPPQLPTSAPPPASATNKQKPVKGGFLGGIFKKNKKKSVVEMSEEAPESVTDHQPNTGSCEIQEQEQEEDDDMYIDGEGCGYSDDDDEAIYEDQ